VRKARLHLPLADGTLAASAGIWCCVLVRCASPIRPRVLWRTLDYDLR
jgi:hypothetical protein